MENLQIALFGGSFDPVTTAHKEIIAKLSTRFDKVIVMPAGVSPFKTEIKPSAIGAQRMEMLKKAARGLNNVTVSHYEIKRDCVSYTVDTLRHIKEKYGASDVYTVIGSEELESLYKWHDTETLKELTTFYVVERVGCPLFAGAVRKAWNDGWKVVIAPFGVCDASSGEVKIARAFGDDCMTVPKSVAKYIVKNNLYNDYKYITDRYKEFGLKDDRIAHIKRVAYAACKLAKRYNVSGTKAVTAALLHDIAKETGREWFERENIIVPEETADMPVKIRHAAYGAIIAEHAFGITDPEILTAIRLHTTGDKNMSGLSMTVFLADCIEEGRKYEYAEQIRLSTRESLEKGMATALGLEVEHLKKEKGEIYPLTLKAYNYYKKLVKSEEETPSEKKKTKEAEKPEEKQAAKKTAEKKKPEEKNTEKKEERKIKKISLTPPSDEPKKEEVGEEKMPEPKSAAESEAHKLAAEIGGYLTEKRGSAVTLINVTDRTVVTDYFVIASANSTTQVRALADYVDEKLSKGKGMEPLHRDANPQWYAVDYGSVIVHIFLKSVREVYDLERLWSDGTNTETLED